MAVDKEKNTQILVTFPNEMLEEIKQFWHKRQLSNRNEAIRELVQMGLNEAKKEDLP